MQNAYPIQEGQKILVVDDSKLTQHIFLRIAEGSGCEAVNGYGSTIDEIITLVSEDPLFKWIALDHVLDEKYGGVGAALMRKIKVRVPEDCSCMGVSATPNIGAQFIFNGADGFLDKQILTNYLPEDYRPLNGETPLQGLLAEALRYVSPVRKSLS